MQILEDLRVIRDAAELLHRYYAPGNLARRQELFGLVRGVLAARLAAAAVTPLDQPTLAAVTALQGRILLQTSDAYEADTFAVLNRAIKLAPEEALAWEALGTLHVRRGAFTDAVSCLSTALGLDPSSASVLRSLSIIVRHDLRAGGPGIERAIAATLPWLALAPPPLPGSSTTNVPVAAEAPASSASSALEVTAAPKEVRALLGAALAREALRRGSGSSSASSETWTVVGNAQITCVFTGGAAGRDPERLGSVLKAYRRAEALEASEAAALTASVGARLSRDTCSECAASSVPPGLLPCSSVLCTTARWLGGIATFRNPDLQYNKGVALQFTHAFSEAAAAFSAAGALDPSLPPAEPLAKLATLYAALANAVAERGGHRRKRLGELRAALEKEEGAAAAAAAAAAPSAAAAAAPAPAAGAVPGGDGSSSGGGGGGGGDGASTLTTTTAGGGGGGRGGAGGAAGGGGASVSGALPVSLASLIPARLSALVPGPNPGVSVRLRVLAPVAAPELGPSNSCVVMDAEGTVMAAAFFSSGRDFLAKVGSHQSVVVAEPLLRVVTPPAPSSGDSNSSAPVTTLPPPSLLCLHSFNPARVAVGPGPAFK